MAKTPTIKIVYSTAFFYLSIVGQSVEGTRPFLDHTKLMWKPKVISQPKRAVYKGMMNTHSAIAFGGNRMRDTLKMLGKFLITSLILSF